MPKDTIEILDDNTVKVVTFVPQTTTYNLDSAQKEVDRLNKEIADSTTQRDAWLAVINGANTKKAEIASLVKPSKTVK